MTNILGDMLYHLKMFEQDLFAELKENVTWEYGYAQPGESYDKPFKGILVDFSKTSPELQGLRDKAERLLYLRLSQEWVPDLEIEDIVIDSLEARWKIVERYDYDHFAGAKVFGVARVDV